MARSRRRPPRDLIQDTPRPETEAKTMPDVKAPPERPQEFTGAVRPEPPAMEGREAAPRAATGMGRGDVKCKTCLYYEGGVCHLNPTTVDKRPDDYCSFHPDLRSWLVIK